MNFEKSDRLFQLDNHQCKLSPVIAFPTIEALTVVVFNSYHQ